MLGFRKTGRQGGELRKDRSAQTSIVNQVVNDLRDGRTVSECARIHNLPKDFIEQIVEHARRKGSLSVVELTKGCSVGPCNPDPDSLICAGCPLVPAGQGKRLNFRTLVGHH